MPVVRKGLRFWLVGWLGALVARVLHWTWRVTVVDPHGVGAGIKDGERPSIVAFWHRHILVMLAHYRGYRVCVPVSESKDGEYVARVMHRFGMASVRGSSSHGSLKLLKGTLARVKEGWSPAITPDGPRGPAYSVQPGFTLLAGRSGLPLFPIGLAAKKAWLLSSWDAFVIPKPFTRVAIVFGDPLRADEFSDRAALADALKDALSAVTEAARAEVGAVGEAS